jgi:hypothetical protein
MQMSKTKKGGRERRLSGRRERGAVLMKQASINESERGKWFQRRKEKERDGPSARRPGAPVINKERVGAVKTYATKLSLSLSRLT